MSELDYMNAIAGAANADEMATSTITQQWKATPLKAADIIGQGRSGKIDTPEDEAKVAESGGGEEKAPKEDHGRGDFHPEARGKPLGGPQSLSGIGVRDYP